VNRTSRPNEYQHGMLAERLQTRQARIGVAGLGHVGLPLAIAFAEAGFQVLGIDIDAEKISRLHAGQSYLPHLPLPSLPELVRTGRLQAALDFSSAGQLDCVILCVPTPLKQDRTPDLSFIVNAGEALLPHVRRDQLYVLESTTYPGTTEEVLRPLLERSGLVVGVDFHLGFSPEREDPGNKHFSTRNIPKVVSGCTPRCLELVQALYATTISQVIPVSSTQVAEMSKLLENIYRSVNIALVNEMKLVCEQMGIDIWEVIDAAATKPFGFTPFYPGPGLGGHCIPIDPFYLTWKARVHGADARLTELAGEINSQMPHHVAERTLQALQAERGTVEGARMLVLGVAYKRDVGDVRESPALEILPMLAERSIQVDYHDPHVPTLDLGPHGRMRSVELKPSSLASYDGVLLLTDHSHVNYGQILENSRLIIDTRSAIKPQPQGSCRIVKA